LRKKRSQLFRGNGAVAFRHPPLEQTEIRRFAGLEAATDPPASAEAIACRLGEIEDQGEVAACWQLEGET
jgi:hypothetical protein